MRRRWAANCHARIAAGRGVVRPIVDRRLPMSRAGEAHALLEAGDHIGKVLLLPEA